MANLQKLKTFTLAEKYRHGSYREELREIEEECKRRDAELAQLRARVSVLESAARIDIDAANSECAASDCMAWISRGMTCGTCPCVTVSSISDALGAALCSVQKVTDYAEAQP